MRPVVVLAVLVAFALPARAGVYNPAEPFNFEIDADGYARPIQYAGGFDLILAKLREVATLSRNPGDPPYPARAEALARVQERQGKGMTSLSAEELAGLTADLIRLNRNDDALGILQPLARDPRRGGFLAFTHLARSHAGRGGWREAYDLERTAVRDSDFPTSFAKLTRTQLTWLRRVETEYYLPFLYHRAEESSGRRPADLREELDVIFPSAVPPKRPTEPVRFVGEDGRYEAGRIAAAERKKLPPDAIAVVQQLVLWHPQDTRLLWLLGELYNAEGDVDTAAKILDKITFDLGYSNPIVIEHRRVLQSAAEAAALERAAAESAQAAKAKAEADEEQARRDGAERDYQKRLRWIIACGVGLVVILVYYQFREVVRRVRRAGREA
ncbi:MAG TPA: hypothetical protein VKE40_00350 [Gemmataceae bacterium]|nr:hypothetical protein [Gemmataceae bacterium]